VHEAETGNYFVTVNFYLLKWKYGQLVWIFRLCFYGAYLIVEEYKIHLDENEGHSSGGRQGQKDVVAFCVPF
jgi:hypothetical protein